MTYSILFSSHRLLKVLEYMALIAIAIAILRPYLGASWFSRVEQFAARLARRRWRAIAFATFFPMAIRLVMLPWYPPPPPQIHDEFSYLLQADTFAHGRVANPTPPFWEHFETEYVLLKPTYASQYQPAQGMVMAAGQVIFGHPWWGVWISTGLMCGALCWALFYVVPPVWALAGALGVALQFGIFGLWMNSYFGGAVAASAGALVFGALIRMRQPGKAASSGALCAVGIILLFATRPLEAVLWAGVALVYCHWWMARRTPVPGWADYTRVLMPFSLVFLIGAGGLAWYNWRITGDPLNPPYLEYRRIYGTPQPFWWQGPLRVASFNFPELRDNYLNQLRLYERRRDWRALLKAEQDRLAHFWRFFIGPFLTPALFFLAFLYRDHRIRPWLFASIPFILDKATYHAWFPSQNAPATILIVLVVLQCWRHLRVWQRERGWGVAITRNAIACLAVTIVLGNLGRAMEPVLPRQLRHLPPLWESLYPAKRLRDDVTAVLEKIPGKHLVFVKYDMGHCFCEEWVFNGADLINQRIVYARPFTPDSDQALAAYLSDHDVWVIEPDSRPYRMARVSDSHAVILARSGGAGTTSVTTE